MEQDSVIGKTFGGLTFVEPPPRQPRPTGALGDLYPNLVARVAGNARRTEFADVRSFPEDFTHDGVTEAELRLAFAAVMDTENWKYPIGVTFAELTDAERYLIGQAVGFYAGCMAEVWTDNETGRAEVWASGYYEAVGS